MKLGTKIRIWYVIVYQKDGKEKIGIDFFKYGESESSISRYCKNIYGKNKRHGPYYQENWAVQKALELEEKQGGNK